MGVVDKVMVWLGFERYEQPATPTSQAKVLYKKRDVDISTARNLLAASSDGENAARAHVELTPFDKAILWIFEKIISPFMNPLPAESTELVTGRQFIDSTSINNISEEEIRAKLAQGEFDKSRNFIKVFLKKNHGLPVEMFIQMRSEKLRLLIGRTMKVCRINPVRMKKIV